MNWFYALGVRHAQDTLGLEKEAKLLLAPLMGAGIGAGGGALSADEGNKLKSALLGALIGSGATVGWAGAKKGAPEFKKFLKETPRLFGDFTAAVREGYRSGKASRSL